MFGQNTFWEIMSSQKICDYSLYVIRSQIYISHMPIQGVFQEVFHGVSGLFKRNFRAVLGVFGEC